MASSKRGDSAGKRRSTQAAGPSRANRTKRNPRPPKSARQAGAVPLQQHGGVGLTVTLRLPSRKSPGRPAARTLSRPGVATLSAIPGRRKLALALVLIVALAGIFVWQTSTSRPVTGGAKVVAAERTAPDFTPLKPADEEASAPKYDGKRNLVTYTTTFSGARLTVSQQPKPAQFDQDDRALERAADSIQAKQRLDTAQGPLYIATKEEGGYQLAVVTVQDVLLFVQSDRKLDDASWKSFVELLKPRS